jgi:predicted 3-demethylubiquinone-9 3-methyltransferase (glyoxalase superfamily)
MTGGHLRVSNIGDISEVHHTLAARKQYLRCFKRKEILMNKNTICLWFERNAEEAARFYTGLFPQSSLGAIHKAPSDYPDGKAGVVLTVEFVVAGIPCIGLNGGPRFKHSEAFSFQISTEDQDETDRYWNAIVNNGGLESQCGWCKDRWGISWQITPRVLTEAMAQGGDVAKRAFNAMMPMRKINVATIQAAVRG